MSIRYKKSIFLLTLLPLFLLNKVFASCGITQGDIRILANDFPALHAVVNEAQACQSSGVTFSKNHTNENKNLQVPALTSNPAQYSAVIVSNSTLVPLLTGDLIQPLDDLLRKYGAHIPNNQRVSIDGKVYAIAFMANAQHLFYRQDILNKAGVGVPTTYEEVLNAAKKIKAAGLMEHPLSGTYKAGWNLAEEFVNMYMGHGGDLFKYNSPEPNINNQKGVATLQMMKALTAYMNPDFLTFDSNAVQAEIEAGKTAIVNLWASRYSAIMDDQGASEAVRNNIKVSAAPNVAANNIPATTLWWDGFVIAKNVSKADAEASFRALANAMTPRMANANADKANWLIPGYVAQASGKGVIESAKGGAKPYPMLPYMGLMHSALGTEIVEFLQGKESAEKALADVEQAYRVAAKEGGYL